MEVEKEIHSLSAETLALTVVLGNVLSRLAATGRTMRFNIAEAFTDAADQVEGIAIRLGKSAASEHTVKALRIVEEMRTIVLGTDKPGRSDAAYRPAAEMAEFSAARPIGLQDRG